MTTASSAGPFNAVELLSPGGAIARALSQFEPRPQQLEMAARVADSFAGAGHLLVEAGTGVGKSFAYLVPAVCHVAAHGGCVVISTHTIALQEQLIHKDIPFLQEALGIKFRAELVKGRSNYLGLRRLQRARAKQEQFLYTDGGATLTDIAIWAKDTKDGSLSELSTQPSPELWESVRSDRNDCMGRRCEHFTECFYQRARRRLADAQILVVNHAMLFSDLALKQDGAALLPPYDYVVLDEAHTAEAVAADHFGASMTESQVNFFLSRLFNDRTQRGLLASPQGEKAIPAVRQARDHAETYFRGLLGMLERSPGWNGRLTAPPTVPQRLSGSLTDLHAKLQQVRKDTDTEQDRFEIEGRMDQCLELANTLRGLHNLELADCVFWLEQTNQRRHPSAAINGRPADVGPSLESLLFASKKSVILTSATLTTASADPFAYIRSRVGLKKSPGVALGSPFDYKRQVTIHVEDDLPDPSSDTFLPAACERMGTYLVQTQGRAFVLFTSYSMMGHAANRMESFLARHDMTLLVQGRGMPRSQMLDVFKTTPRCVLFGTDSFWQGVDVPGEALSNVIIVKLPFAVPSHPLMEARIESIRQRGGNPFEEFQLPEAVLKLKQGFGRLIRTATDRGIVVILDRRLRTKPYGRRFLAALPECRVVCASAAEG
jgi:ATP-dependent DNA helicase DinG